MRFVLFQKDFLKLFIDALVDVVVLCIPHMFWDMG